MVKAPERNDNDSRTRGREVRGRTWKAGGFETPRTTGKHAGHDLPPQFLQRPEVIFGVGRGFTTTNFGAPIPSGKTFLHLTNNQADLNKDVPADLALLGDAKLVLGQLIEEVWLF